MSGELDKDMKEGSFSGPEEDEPSSACMDSVTSSVLKRQNTYHYNEETDFICFISL